MTRPEVRSLAKAAYAFGGTIDIFGHWLHFGLMQPVFVGFLHLSPSLLGLTHAAARLTDGLTDSHFGSRSDNTRTRWGRRRPYILVGSLLAGTALPCLFARRGHRAHRHCSGSCCSPSAAPPHPELLWYAAVCRNSIVPASTVVEVELNLLRLGRG